MPVFTIQTARGPVKIKADNEADAKRKAGEPGLTPMEDTGSSTLPQSEEAPTLTTFADTLNAAIALARQDRSEGLLETGAGFAPGTLMASDFNDILSNLDASTESTIASFANTLEADNDLLSPGEAQTLGVPYGTTKAQAAQMGIMPSDQGSTGSIVVQDDGQGNLYGIDKTTGQTVWTKAGGAPPKPLTEAQAKDVAYASRADEANTYIQNLQGTIVAYNPLRFAAAVAAEGTTLGNVGDQFVNVIPDEVRQQRQAERNFLTAVLRRESGAQILPSEFATGALQYFPRPGDDEQTLKQKAQNRATAIAAFKATNPNQGGGQFKEVNGVRYQKVPGGWQKVSFNSVGGDTKTAMNRPQRNNNPGNIKASQFTKSFPGVAGVDPVPAADGGNFLVFQSPEDGLNAAKRLLTSQVYSGLSVDAALKKWSGGGYGGEIVPSLKNKRVDQLSPTELDALMRTMFTREGAFA